MAATVTLKLKPYLQEYLKCKLGQDNLSAKGNIIGTFLKPFLQIRPPDVENVVNTGPEYITIEIPTIMDLEVRNGTVYISPKNNSEFEKILNAHFWDVFYSYMDDKVRYMNKENTRKGTIKRVILQFCSDWNISYDHLNYEMMKKAYYRRSLLHEKKSKHFTKNLSLTRPLFFLM